MNLFSSLFTLLSYLCLTNAFAFYEVLNSHRVFLKQLNSVIGLFESSTTFINWIEQPIDHFNEKDNRTWQMRYFERIDFWKEEGPVYLFINGEAEGSDVLLRTGILYELAKETNGAMYASEHRYYGKSQPFKKISAENLTYLSARQAIGDVAKLLQEIKSLPQYNHSKVVVVGGSYAGNLAAWLKLLHPELVDAAVASSAPVLAKADFYEYLEAVSDDFEQYGTTGCHNNIRRTFNRYDELFQTSTGIEELKEKEHICNSTDMTKEINKQVFFLDKAVQFMYVAQYGNTRSIKNFCDKMPNSDVISKNFDLWSQRGQCYNYEFNDMIDNMKQIDWVMAWTYQTCTEFGYFMTTSSSKHPFTDNIGSDLFYNMCTDMYGTEFDEKRVAEGVKMTNNLFYGLRPNVTQVVFVNGDLDPWARLGILEDLSYNAPAKVIPRSSHCRDLFSNGPMDHEELKESRKYVKYLIKKWIDAEEFKNDLNITNSLLGI